MVIKDGVDFDSLDGEPVHLLFLIAAPDTEDNIHLEVLSKLSVMLMDDNFTKSLKNASSVDEFMEIINKADEERPDLSEQFGGSEEAPAEEKPVPVHSYLRKVHRSRMPVRSEYRQKRSR